MTRLPRGVECVNCGSLLLGARCDVCGYVRRKAPVYPIGHDKLTDSYQKQPPPNRVARP